MRVHTGETLASIAARAHTTVGALAAANDLRDPNLIKAGTLLRLPTAGLRGTLTVAAGETLTDLAVRDHTTLAALAAANGLRNLNTIYAGEVLELPHAVVPGQSSGGTVVRRRPATIAIRRHARTVVVRRGQTLSGIAGLYGTTVAALMRANRIADPDRVLAGRRLRLPAPGSATRGSGSTQAPAASQPPGVPAPQSVSEPAVATTGGSATSPAASTPAPATSPQPASSSGGSSPTGSSPTGSTSSPTGSTSSPTGSTSAPTGSAPASFTLPAVLLANPQRLALQPYFQQSAATYGVPVSLLEALCWWESGWQQSVVSSTGAIGTCQVEPSTATFVNTFLSGGQPLAISSAAGNIALGAAYLAYLLRQTGGSESEALAGYFQGLTSVQLRGFLPQTRDYVAGILAYSQIFAAAA